MHPSPQPEVGGRALAPPSKLSKSRYNNQFAINTPKIAQQQITITLIPSWLRPWMQLTWSFSHSRKQLVAMENLRVLRPKSANVPHKVQKNTEMWSREQSNMTGQKENYFLAQVSCLWT